MNKPHIIFSFLGRTASGKSSIAQRVCDDLGLKLLKSYTTRPPRESEKIHTDHIFIKNDEVEKYKDDIVAYTEIADNIYFCTKEQLLTSDVYVIDYEGVKYLREQNIDGLHIKPIYIDARLDDRTGRYIARVIQRDKNYEKAINEFIKRNKDEESQFDELEEKCDYDLIVDNSKDFECAIEQVEDFIKSIRG